MSLPPMGQWGFVIRHRQKGGPHYWTQRAVKFKPAGGGKYQMVVKNSHTVPGSFALVDVGNGFLLDNGHSRSSRLTWQPDRS